MSALAGRGISAVLAVALQLDLLRNVLLVEGDVDRYRGFLHFVNIRFLYIERQKYVR